MLIVSLVLVCIMWFMAGFQYGRSYEIKKVLKMLKPPPCDFGQEDKVKEAK